MIDIETIKIETMFANTNLLRAEICFERKKFLIENKGKYKTQAEEIRAVNNHLNRKYKEQTDFLLTEKLRLINEKWRNKNE